MLTPEQAGQLAAAGLDYYNHNIDSSPEYYERIITTRTFQDRLDTLENVRAAGIAVCSGGIVGMGETRDDRVGFIHTLATLPQHPESVPVNALVPVKGTVLGDMLADTPLAKIDDIEFVRTVAAARISHAALDGAASPPGRESMSEATQALCFLAGANSIFTGDKLLTAPNAGDDADAALFAKLGLRAAGGRGADAGLRGSRGVMHALLCSSAVFGVSSATDPLRQPVTTRSHVCAAVRRQTVDTTTQTCGDCARRLRGHRAVMNEQWEETVAEMKRLDAAREAGDTQPGYYETCSRRSAHGPYRERRVPLGGFLVRGPPAQRTIDSQCKDLPDRSAHPGVERPGVGLDL
jgi:hypothetical protein